MSLFSVALLALGLGAAPPLTEDRAVELAVSHSPALRALASRVDEARAQVDVAGRWANPELRVQNLRSDLLLAPALKGSTYSDHPFGGAKVGLRWFPPELGLRTERRAAAELEVAQSLAQRAQAERDLTARVRGLHATLLSLEKQVELARRALEERDRLRALARRRLDRSAATALEQSSAQLDYLEAANARQELEARRGQALDELRIQLGLPEGEAVELSGEGSGACAPPADSTALLEQAARGSARLSEFPARLQAVESAHSHRILQLLPWPDYLQLSYVLPSDKTPAYLTLQFGLTLPLLDWKTADRRALGAKRVRIEEERRAEVMELERRVRRAAAEQAEQAELRVRLREAESILEGSLQQARRALEAGETTDLAQVSRLETRALAARRASLRAELECRLRQIELERLAGSGAVTPSPAPSTGKEPG
jgi:outer membrane protein TolC